MHEKTKDGKQVVSGSLKRCGRPVLAEDGRRRECVTGSCAAATADQLWAWRLDRHRFTPITKMGDLLDHLTEWAKKTGYNPASE